MAKITYYQVGDNYDTKDPIKKLAQITAAQTSTNLAHHGFQELPESRGESAFVWKQGSILMASVIEGLGTKNLIADDFRKVIEKPYYEIIAHDTIATIINDLVTVGAKPLVINAFWAIGDNRWFEDERMKDLITGWKKACDVAKATWGGGETPTLKGIIDKRAIVLGGSAVGIIGSQKRLLMDKKIKTRDRIILLKSTGINTNGLSLARAIAKKLPLGYGTKLASGQLYGDAILNRSNIYAKLVADLLDEGMNLHYVVNITGHGLRKLMRARQDYAYIVEKVFEPLEVFNFIQEEAHLSDYEMYGTFNMGMDYALFLPEKDVSKALRIIKKNKFEGIEAGYIEKGERKVVIKPKDIIYSGNTLDLR